MASSPSTELAEVPRKEEVLQDVVATLIHNGRKPGDIAKAVHPDDDRKRKQLRHKIRRWTYESEDFHRRVAVRTHGTMVMGLGPAAQALVRRAGRGNPTAIRLLFEASGFHNPKMQHEHSGEVTIKLEMPRPPVVADEAGQVTDAEVVED